MSQAALTVMNRLETPARDVWSARKVGLIIAPGSTRDELAEDVALLGGCVTARFDTAVSPGDVCDRLALCELLVAQLPSAASVEWMSELLALGGGLNGRILLVLTEMHVLDLAYALVADETDPVFMVVGSSRAERLAEMGRLLGIIDFKGRVREGGDRTGPEQLRALTDAVTQLTDQLARISNREQEPGLLTSVAAPAIGFRSSGPSRPQVQSSIGAATLRRFIKARRLRTQFFDETLFADPAWDMILDLAAARLENRDVSVTSLCIASYVPPTTALRWIKLMTESGLFVRRDDRGDRRRAFLDLSDDTFAAVQTYVALTMEIFAEDE